jgi:Holliday junction resolvase RusA-like endonuclease
MRYRAFRDAVWALSAKWRRHLPDGGVTVTFHLPMPKSWSHKKQSQMIAQPHQQKPDLDNLLKALLDSLYPDDDTHVWDVRAIKVWDTSGRITLEWDE